MGIFSKESCAVCGGKLSLLTKLPISDGAICGECLKKCTQRIDLPRSRTKEDIVENMREKAENRKLYSVFRPQKYEPGLFVDFQNKLFALSNFSATASSELKKQSMDIFRFCDIEGYDFLEDGNTIQKSGLGSAVVGGLLFGGAGLVLGGLAGHKQKETISKLSVVIHMNSKWSRRLEAKIITTETKKGSLSYSTAKSTLEQLVTVLDNMISAGKTEQ